jgi:hypothetical protein
VERKKTKNANILSQQLCDGEGCCSKKIKQILCQQPHPKNP